MTTKQHLEPAVRQLVKLAIGADHPTWRLRMVGIVRSCRAVCRMRDIAEVDGDELIATVAAEMVERLAGPADGHGDGAAGAPDSRAPVRAR
jgi:hypothetical protein